MNQLETENITTYKEAIKGRLLIQYLNNTYMQEHDCWSKPSARVVGKPQSEQNSRVRAVA
jgi:hypothetical protein